MKAPTMVLVRNAGLGLSVLLLAAPLVYADRSQQPQRGGPAPRGEPAQRIDPAPRGLPAHALEERRPVAVERANHGTIRHVDTHVVQRPVEVNREASVRQNVYQRHDVDVDVHRRQYWHGFVYGSRHHSLREGFFPLLVNGLSYFFDGGIYFQQVGNDYQEVYPPIGAIIPALPDGAIELVAGNLVYYYACGAFYVQQNGGFCIAAPPMGVVVPELPPGAVQVSVNGGIAYQFSGIYYQPVFVNGVTQYMTFMP